MRIQQKLVDSIRSLDAGVGGFKSRAGPTLFCIIKRRPGQRVLFFIFDTVKFLSCLFYKKFFFQQNLGF